MNKHYLFSWLLISLLLVATTTTHAQTLYVSTTGTQPASAATTWATSTTDLQGAINSLSVTGGEVWVAAGMYKPTTGTDRTISFTMRNNVAIYGGFVGNETDLSGRPAINPVTGQPSSSTLSGDIGGAGDTDNSYHVISNPTGLTTTAILDGFIITKGNANGTFSESDGGGMFNNTSSPTISNCIFRLNTATSDGGGLYNSGSSPVITNSIFEDNEATATGGGITNRSTSNPSLTDCIFRRNTSAEGGGMLSVQGSPIITRCLFQNNTASTQGGALLQSTGTPVITNCVFQSNTASYIGAIAQNGGNSRVVNCAFRQNQAINSIGAIWVSNSSTSMTLTNCSFEENTASLIGVLKTESGGKAYLTNCSFQNNSATTGAQTMDAAGGITLTNCVFWNNGSNPANAFSNNPTASYCLFPVGTTGFTNGGNNLTTSISPFASTTSVTLNACSPAINTGDNSATGLTGITTDLESNTRVFGGVVDMGAVEFSGDGQPASFSLLGSGTATCASSPTLTLSDSETGVNYQLQHNGINTGGALAGTGATLSFGPQSVSGTYTVLATRTVNSCTALMAASTTISSNTTPPSVTITTVSNLSVIDCNVTVLSLSASGGGTYSWDNSQTVVSRNVNAGGTYSVTITGANGCTAIATKTISQSNTPPPVSLTAIDVCAGQSVTLTATGGISSYTFVGGSGVIGSGSTNFTTVSGLSAGPQSFTVRVRNSVTSCTNTATASVTVNELPTPTLTAGPSNTLTCAQPSLTLTATGGNSYTFARTGGGAGLVSSDPVAGTAVVNAAGTYSVTAINASGCTSVTSTTISSNTATVSVTNPATNTAAQSVPFSQTFTASGGVAPRTFALASGTLPTGLTLGTDGVLSGIATLNGTFTITVRATDPNSCSGVSSTYSLTVVDLMPTITNFAATVTSVCTGKIVTFTATVGNVTGSYAYTLISTAQSTNSNTSSTAFSETLTVSGTSPQTITLIVSDNGLSQTATTSLIVNPLPSVFYTVGPAFTITQGNTYTITAVSGGNSFRWSTGATTATLIDTPTAIGSNLYSITLTTPAGCSIIQSPNTTVLAPACYPVVHVTQNGAGLQNGSSWANAYPGTMLQTAINSATSCSGQVWVATGMYKPTSYTGAGSRTLSFLMRNNVAIYGGFVGTETTLTGPTGRTITMPSGTTLSAEIDNDNTNTNNSYHVVVANALNSTARLDGFVITGGNANAATGFEQFGGGMLNANNSSPIVANCTLENNTAVFGAGLNNYIGAPSLQNCVFQNNVATSNGGGLYSFFGIGLTLTNCVVQNNSATSGGGLYSDSGRLLLTNCTVQSNSATVGGAFVLPGTGYSLTLTNSIVWNNGGDNSFLVITGTLVATYSLFEPSSITYVGLTSGPGNLTTSVSPFASITSNELAACSPAIDRGDNSATGLTGITTDLAGNNRFFNNGVVDMGAYEFAGEGQPISFSLLGSGTATCASSPTLTLNSSETGVSYQLQRNDTNTGSLVTGTGSALSFGSQPTSGTYTVLATRTSNSCTAVMVTSATVVSGTGTVSVTNPVTLTAIQTVAFSQTFTASGGVAPQTFTLASGTLPMGLSLSASGVLSGTPTGTLGTFPITVRATDANSCSTLSGPYSLTLLDPRPSITNFMATPNVVCVNGPATFTVTLTDLPRPYSYTLSDGTSFTTGSSSLSLLSLTATPGSAGQYTYTLTVLGYAATSFAVTSLTVGILTTNL